MMLLTKVWSNLKRIFFRDSLTPKCDIEQERARSSNLQLGMGPSIPEPSLPQDESPGQTQVAESAKLETSRMLVRFSEDESLLLQSSNVTPNKKLIELLELEGEIQKLEEHQFILTCKLNEIQPISLPDLSQIITGIESLRSSLNNNPYDRQWALKSPDLALGKFESFSSRNSLFQCYKKREFDEFQKEEALYKEIQKKLSKLEIYLDKTQLIEARGLIIVLTNQMRPHFSQEVNRLAEAKKRLKEKEIEIFKRKEDHELTRRLEDAKKLQEHAQQLLNAAAAEEQKRHEASKALLEQKKKQEGKLNQLLSYKENWREFQFILDANQIEHFYHFTDEANIKSIISNGGLFSWDYCNKNDIIIERTANSPEGRHQDLRYNLQDFVRLSFISDHPMKHVAFNTGRISKPYTLLISREVCFFNETRFSNMNAADKFHQNCSKFEFFKALRFGLFKKSYFNLEGFDKKFYQAEVMAKTWIPIKYILNLENYKNDFCRKQKEEGEDTSFQVSKC